MDSRHPVKARCCLLERTFRRSTGTLGICMEVLLIGLLIALGSFAVDSAHLISAQRELQSAVDAAALAGAVHVDQDPAKAVAEALYIASCHKVELVPVVNDGHSTKLTVYAHPGTNKATGTLTVTATRKTPCLFAQILGHRFGHVQAHAVAGGAGTVNQVPAGHVFPIAVSISAQGGTKDEPSYLPLSKHFPGEAFQIIMGATKYENAAFTSFYSNAANNSYIRGCIDEALDERTPTQPLIPSIQVGKEINVTNGEAPFEYLLRDPQYGKLISTPYLILVLIDGEPPFNKSNRVIGFMTFRVTSVTKDHGACVIGGVITRRAIVGQSDTTMQQPPAAVTNLSSLCVKLLK